MVFFGDPGDKFVPWFTRVAFCPFSTCEDADTVETPESELFSVAAFFPHATKANTAVPTSTEITAFFISPPSFLVHRFRLNIRACLKIISAICETHSGCNFIINGLLTIVNLLYKFPIIFFFCNDSEPCEMEEKSRSSRTPLPDPAAVCPVSYAFILQCLKTLKQCLCCLSMSFRYCLMSCCQTLYCPLRYCPLLYCRLWFHLWNL